MMQVPLDNTKDGEVVLVEADRGDILDGLTLASPILGRRRQWRPGHCRPR